ncbi:MAG: zinc transporter ZupT [Deltaproteobacteria bacterium ADurb.BinA179]|jgi:zinc and cadmium transporter|nr:ZIP family metal transporter [Pseudomonadota bacterium]OPZ27693.1 MAG: zinc transporter ZupT [Deltaproteobacteria bacterium ADurb.BinA179]HNU73477.1 ZIP family metal transporter [Deltaproteobacteria bacterium]HRR21201.1 ZIP family metal transporter [Desulfomonilia bacterium]HOD72190.1 ZIP family metal transporter [Deltaproteobacteria bacterium]
MSPLAAIMVFGALMSVIALVGSMTLVLKEMTLRRILPLLVAFASGSLIGGAFFLMIPAAIENIGNTMEVFLWIAGGFFVFLALEQLLQWHHCHRSPAVHTRPVSTMLLIADGLHNLIGGLSIGALFISDFRLGLVAWYAAVAHEIPQELGDFGVLVHGGWGKGKALLYNFLSALTFPAGGLIAYALSSAVSVEFLVPFAAGNFLYIGAVDLVPEFRESPECGPNIPGTFAWVLGMAILYATSFFHYH